MGKDNCTVSLMRRTYLHQNLKQASMKDISFDFRNKRKNHKCNNYVFLEDILLVKAFFISKFFVM